MRGGGQRLLTAFVSLTDEMINIEKYQEFNSVAQRLACDLPAYVERAHPVVVSARSIQTTEASNVSVRNGLKQTARKRTMGPIF